MNAMRKALASMYILGIFFVLPSALLIYDRVQVSVFTLGLNFSFACVIKKKSAGCLTTILSTS